MKILVAHRYYWPDSAPYASLLHSIVRSWAGEGHDVDVISALPSYKDGYLDLTDEINQEFDGITITRLKLKKESGTVFRRIFNAFCLVSYLFCRAVIRKYDVIMISTYPPILGGFVAALASKVSGAKFIYHCMDLHPEIGVISGEFRNSKFFAFLRAMDEFSCNVADPVVVLSKDMARTLRRRNNTTKTKIRIINNFGLPREACESESRLPFDWPEGGLVILYAGNVGRFQGLDALLTAMLDLQDRPDVHLIIMGDGSEKIRFEQLVLESSANVRFTGHLSPVDAQKAMQIADIGFLSLVPDVYRYAYPSKTVTYLQQSLPILAFIEVESQLSAELAEYRAGFTVSNATPQILSEKIRSLADERTKLKAMRLNAENFYKDRFLSQNILPLWSELVHK